MKLHSRSKKELEIIRTKAALYGVIIATIGFIVGCIALRVNLDNYELTKEVRLQQSK